MSPATSPLREPAVRATALRLVTAGLRSLAKEMHPDAGGSNEEMARANVAADALRGYIGSGGEGAEFVPPPPPPRQKPLVVVSERFRARIRWRGGSSVWCVKIAPVRVVDTREMALEVEIGDELLWVPRSQLTLDSEVQDEGDEGVMGVSLMWADQKGLVP